MNEVPDNLISRLYLDYRSDSYNRERDFYEPGYIKNISKKIGKIEEANSRVSALNDYLSRMEVDTVFDRKKINLALDWGGADGRFLPDLPAQCKKYVFEISNIEPVEHVNKVTNLSENLKFDYIQLAHVLEHLSNPSNFLKEIKQYLNKNAYLYIEVPLEVDELNFAENVKSGSILLGVHEHINKYTIRSMSYLIESLELELIDISVELVDMVWAKNKVIRVLGRK